MNRSKVDYCDYLLNVITGCKKTCRYCNCREFGDHLAGDIRKNRIIGERYKCGDSVYELDKPFENELGKELAFPFGFAPTLHRYKYASLDKLKSGYNVLVGGMGDMFGDWVPEEWINYVFEICLAHGKNIYMFVTQNPERYKKLILPETDNFVFGTMVNCKKELYRLSLLPAGYKKMVRIDPIQEDLELEMREENIFAGIDWVVIGAEVGRKRSRVIPEKEWIEKIVFAADEAGVPIFMRDSLKKHIGEENMRRDYPEFMKEHEPSDKVLKKIEGRCMKCHKKILKRDMMSITARRKNSGKTLLLGHICKTCYLEKCKELGINLDEAKNAYENKKQEEKNGKKNN